MSDGVDPRALAKATRAEFTKRVLIVVTALMVAACLVVMLVTLLKVGQVIVEVRATQKTGSPLGRQILAQQKEVKRGADAATATNEQVLDCLQPTGECFKQSQAQTAGVVGQIGAGNILAVVCALQVPNGTPLQQALDQVTACVAAQLADAASTP